MLERLRPAYVVLLVLAFAVIAFAFVVGQSSFWVFLNAKGTKAMLVASGGLFPLLWVSGVAVSITRRRIDRPTATLVRMISRQRWWLARGASFVVIIFMFARSFSGFKTSIPRINPFWADPMLADLDAITFGTDPWRLTHAVFGDAGTIFLDRVYLLWFLMMFLTLGWFCFTRNPKLQVRGLMSYLLSWALLGCGVALAWSSVGPCFYEQFYGDARFAPMMAKLAATNENTKLVSMESMQFLIASLEVDRFGGGISAMPSMHVTVAMLSFLAVLTYSRSRLLKIASGFFTACIFVGSVHLGWHYAWDGILGIVVVTIFWWATGRYVDWLDRRGQTQATNARPFTTLPARF